MDYSQPAWKVGARAARANLLPGLVVQGLMVAIIISYYTSATARQAFDILGRFKTEAGLQFVLLSSAFSGAIFPELLKILIFQRGRVARENWVNVRFQVPYWLVSGFIVDILYTAQNRWFGNGLDWHTITKKVLVDQLLYSPLFANAATVYLFELRRRNWNFSVLPSLLNIQFIKQRVVPLVLASWTVWIPLVSLLYAMPFALQFPIFSLILSFWALLLKMIAAGD
jgi:hypothetical protein